MNRTEQAAELLAHKKELFLEYEQTTQEMLTCPFEELEACIARRTELIERIDLLDARLAELDAQAPEQKILAAARNRGERGALPAQSLCLFDLAQSIFSVINRIANCEHAVLERMKREKDELREQIKSTNNTPKIAKFLTTLDTTFEKGTFFDSKK